MYRSRRACLCTDGIDAEAGVDAAGGVDRYPRRAVLGRGECCDLSKDSDPGRE